MEGKALLITSKSKYQWKEFFVERLAGLLEEMGVDLMVVNLSSLDAVSTLNDQKEPKFLFSLETDGLGISSIVGPKWVELLGAQIFSYLLKHPLYYHPCLSELKTWNVAFWCANQNAVPYIERCYKQFEETEYVVPPAFQGKQPDKPYQERGIELLVPATWQEPRDLAAKIKELPGSFAEIATQLVGMATINPDSPLEALTERYMQVIGVPVYEDEMGELMHCFRVICDYLQAYYLDAIVRQLLAAGISVTVCGEGWEQFTDDRQDQLTILGGSEGLPFEELLDVMGDTKVVLQNQISSPQGIGMRTLCAMANGAAVITDQNPVLEEVFNDQESVVFYDNREIEEVAQRVSAALEHPEVLEQIAEKGKRIAKDMGAEKRFAEQILKHCR